MIYKMLDVGENITDTDLKTVVPDNTIAFIESLPDGPMVVCIDRDAIQFEPAGTRPESEREEEVVARALARNIDPKLDAMARKYDKVHWTENLYWRSLVLDAERLSEYGITLTTKAHYIHRTQTEA